VTAITGKDALSVSGLPFCKACIDRNEYPASLDVLLVIFRIATVDIMVRQHPCDRSAGSADGGANGCSSWNCRRGDCACCSEWAYAGNGESSNAQQGATDAAADDRRCHATLAGTIVIIISAAVVIRRSFVRLAHKRDSTVRYAGAAKLAYGAFSPSAIIEYGRYYVLAHVITPVGPLCM
jgi:hypothetical protein